MKYSELLENCLKVQRRIEAKGYKDISIEPDSTWNATILFNKSSGDIIILHEYPISFKEVVKGCEKLSIRYIKATPSNISGEVTYIKVNNGYVESKDCTDWDELYIKERR